MKHSDRRFTALGFAGMVVLALLAAPAAHAQCDRIPNCRLVWSDEFEGSAVDSAKWEFQSGDGTAEGIPGWGNHELQWYQAANASVANGLLTIQARQQAVGGKAYTSARLLSLGRGDFRYGRFEMRARLPVGQGMWPAFWMLPSDSAYGVWAASGEIDIMESIGSSTIHGTIHYGGTFPDNTYSGGTTILSGSPTDFHTYAVEWEPGEIRWYLDGQLFSTKTQWFSSTAPFPAPFDQNFHLLLNLAVGGNFPGSPDASTVFPQNFVIDYVRVYQEAAPVDARKAVLCESAKAGQAGRYAKCRANLFADAIRRAESVDAARLTKCADKADTTFGRAESRADGSCPTRDDSPAVRAAVDACVADAASALGGVPGPGGVESLCQASKLKEVGNYADCLLKATAKALRQGRTFDTTRCSGRIARKWGRLEGRTSRPCAADGDLTAIQSRVDDCRAAIAASLSAPACGNGIVESGEECDDGNTAGGDGCSSTCQVQPEYAQDFEELAPANATALSGDGWIVFANVFHGGTGAYLYGYGTNPAPNGGSAFSAIALGEGGPAQGGRQLSIYSDYNNGDHGNGHTIEALVFRERPVTADGVGTTIQLSFDAKRGNLGGASTALAFVKTLDPNAGYAQTSFASQVTTAIPTTWARYDVSLDIAPSLVGHVLQYGFSNRATHYEGSGVLYDNLVVLRTPTQ